MRLPKQCAEMPRKCKNPAWFTVKPEVGFLQTLADIYPAPSRATSQKHFSITMTLVGALQTIHQKPGIQVLGQEATFLPGKQSEGNLACRTARTHGANFQQKWTVRAEICCCPEPRWRCQDLISTGTLVGHHFVMPAKFKGEWNKGDRIKLSFGKYAFPQSPISMCLVHSRFRRKGKGWRRSSSIKKVGRLL